MPVRSRRLWTVVCPLSTNTQLYVVPAGRTAIVRTITFTNQSTTVAGAFTLLLNGSSASANGLLRSIAPGAAATYVFDRWLALNPADELRLSTAAGSGFLVAGFGALLLGAPE